jgi:hypothetical protein
LQEKDLVSPYFRNRETRPGAFINGELNLSNNLVHEQILLTYTTTSGVPELCKYSKSIKQI